MKNNTDAFGENLLAQYYGGRMMSEFVERDDGYLDTGSDPGAYFETYKDWSKGEQRAIGYVRGRVLDIGCGAGRHSFYLQQKGFDVTAIDNSPGAVKVCKLRGIKKAMVRSIEEVDKFPAGSFDTVLMMGNNFGLLGSRRKARILLKKLARVIAPNGKIIAGSLDPYKTTNPDHLLYHKRNKKLGRMAGQIRFRIRFKDIIGKWFDYLFVSRDEMQDILSETDWRAEKFIKSFGDNYFAVIGRK
ncbi:MAG TPA: class I SAM-dependent methyltransferase [Pyrinomonadaceae bacterium]|nr:class I SAM-dependent methyltransferase [Pyrinomonadaceae bacterium]